MTYTPIPRGTQQWDVPLNAALAQMDANITSSAGAALQAANNLSDLTNPTLARQNLGLAASAAVDATWINVKDHGAVGNGTADDTSAIQLAISICSGNGGGVVYFPRGTYKISQKLTIVNRVTLMGAGPNATIIQQTATAQDCIFGTDVTYVAIKEMQLLGPGSGTGIGIDFTLTNNAANVYIDLSNVSILSFGSHGIFMQNPIVSDFRKVVVQTNGGDGFHIVGKTFPGAAGTSVNFHACYANGNTNIGYYLYNMVYTNLSACAADSNAAGYVFDNCQSVNASGCGAEAQVGHSFRMNASYGVSLNSCWVYNNNSIGIYVTGNTNTAVITGCTDNSPLGGATAFIKVDSGSHATLSANHNTTANSLASGTTNILDDSAGGVQFNGYTFVGGTAEFAGAVNLDAGPITVNKSTSVGNAINAQVNGDSIPRFTIQANGGLNWGTGSAAQDVNLYRGAANALQTDDTFIVGQSARVNSNLVVGSTNILGDNGVGEIQLANATTVPTTNPSGGAIIYATGGSVQLRNSQGLVRSIVGSVNGSNVQTTVANTTTETTIGSLTIPANDMVVGAIYRLRAWGTFSVTGTPTLRLRSYVGSTAIAATGNVTVGTSGITNRSWSVETYFTVLSTGSSGTVMGHMTFPNSIASTSSANPTVTTGTIEDGGSVITVNTTTSNTFTLQATWGTASTSNTLTAYGVMAERVA
jgi:hypothetical protein